MNEMLTTMHRAAGKGSARIRRKDARGRESGVQLIPMRWVRFEMHARQGISRSLSSSNNILLPAAEKWSSPRI